MKREIKSLRRQHFEKKPHCQRRRALKVKDLIGVLSVLTEKDRDLEVVVYDNEYGRYCSIEGFQKIEVVVRHKGMYARFHQGDKGKKQEVIELATE